MTHCNVGSEVCVRASYKHNGTNEMVVLKIVNYGFREVGRDSVAGIATRYGLDGPGIESRWGRDFQRPSRPALRSTQPPVQWVPGHGRG